MEGTAPEVLEPGFCLSRSFVLIAECLSDRAGGSMISAGFVMLNVTTLA